MEIVIKYIQYYIKIYGKLKKENWIVKSEKQGHNRNSLGVHYSYL